MEFICKNCGKTFSESKNRIRKFCCQKCANEYKRNNKKEKKYDNLIKVICAECGKEEFVVPSRAKKYKCCSVSCLGKFNSKRYNKHVTLICPICGKEYTCKQSKTNHHRTCGDKICRSKWLSMTRVGKNNSNYKTIEELLKKQNLNTKKNYSYAYQRIVKDVLGLKSVLDIPKGYVVHHKDCNHFNNNVENLVVLTKTVHRLVHTIFGNVLINALHTNKISRELFFSICTEEQKNFYKQIIDLNVTHQAVVKQGELLEVPEEVNQHPSVYRNIYEGSTTNIRTLTDNAEGSNDDTSALPVN